MLRTWLPGARMVLLAGVFLGSAGFYLPSPSCHAASPVSRVANAEHSRGAKSGLPFDAGDVVRHLSDTLNVSPRKGNGNTTVFENRGEDLPENRYRISVEQEQGDVVVSFVGSGHNAMSSLREFVECPLFSQRESAQLHQMLEEADGSQTLKLSRFSVSVRSWDAGNRFHIILRFFQPDKVARL